MNIFTKPTSETGEVVV